MKKRILKALTILTFAAPLFVGLNLTAKADEKIIYVSVDCKISNDGTEAAPKSLNNALLNATAGQTILAGQPLSGDIKNRDAEFAAGSEAVGILLHDVVLDADGKGNGTIVLAGCVDLLKLEGSIQTAIAEATGLDRIIFVKGSAY